LKKEWIVDKKRKGCMKGTGLSDIFKTLIFILDASDSLEHWPNSDECCSPIRKIKSFYVHEINGRL